MGRVRHFRSTARGRPDAGEVRTRSGCWKCRERRVKCPEQRPTCEHCRRLGFLCTYEVRLTWQTSSVHKTQHRFQKLPLPPVRHWMFLNTSSVDLLDNDIDTLCDLSQSSHGANICSITSHSPGSSGSSMASDSGKPSTCPLSSPTYSSSPSSTSQDHNIVSPIPGSFDIPDVVMAPYLSPFPLSPQDAYLWDYFATYVIPRVSVDDVANPYRNVLLRVAAASPYGPLFHCIAGASATQLYTLGFEQHVFKIWQCRAHALGMLRQSLESHPPSADPLSWDLTLVAQIIGSTVMLCFSEVLRDCSDTWIIHANFSLSYLDLERAQSALKGRSSVLSELAEFCLSYFTHHRVLAGTAVPRLSVAKTAMLQARFPSGEITSLQSLTGYPHQLLAIIEDITELAQNKECDPTLSSLEFTARRGTIERQLHSLQNKNYDYSQQNRIISHDKSEFGHFAELLRMTTLIYLHSRLDNSGPHEPHLMRLTGRTLELLEMTPLRTNTILWSLFIVATLGVRPESDYDRKLVIRRLTELQYTRQMGNVKKARQIIEYVWRLRDLKTSYRTRGWSILSDRCWSISLA